VFERGRFEGVSGIFNLHLSDGAVVVWGEILLVLFGQFVFGDEDWEERGRGGKEA